MMIDDFFDARYVCFRVAREWMKCNLCLGLLRSHFNLRFGRNITAELMANKALTNELLLPSSRDSFVPSLPLLLAVSKP